MRTYTKYAVLFGFLAFALVGQSYAQTLDLSDGKLFYGLPRTAFSTTYHSNATTWHYGNVQDSRRAKEITIAVTVVSGGATSYSRIAIEWLPVDPTDNLGNLSKTPWAGLSYSESGYPANALAAISGLWSCREFVPMLQDGEVPTTISEKLHVAATTYTVSADAVDTQLVSYELVATGNYIGTVSVKAPYYRIAVYYAVAEDLPMPSGGDMTVGVWTWPRAVNFIERPFGELHKAIAAD